MADESHLRAGSLCVVGNINRDIKAAPFAADSRLFQDGETSVGWIIETVGGGGANSAFAAAALGARVSFVSRVGADALADRLSRALTGSGIREFLSRDELRPSGTSLALSFENGRRHFLSCLPANAALCFEDVNPLALEGCAHLLRADLWFSESMLFGGNARLFEAAKARGLAVSVDLNWDPVWGTGARERIRLRKQAVRDVLPWVDLAHGNRRELCEFADAADLSTALRNITSWGAGAVVVHLGREGAGYYQEGRWCVVPASPVENPVTQTGCGDVLSVCLILLSQTASGSWEERLRLANQVVAEYMEGRRSLVPVLEG